MLFSPAVHSRKMLSTYQALSFIGKSFPVMLRGVLDLFQIIILTFYEVIVCFHYLDNKIKNSIYLFICVTSVILL